MMAKIKSETDPDARSMAVQELDRYLLVWHTNLPLTQSQDTAAYRSDLSGVLARPHRHLRLGGDQEKPVGYRTACTFPSSAPHRPGRRGRPVSAVKIYVYIIRRVLMWPLVLFGVVTVTGIILDPRIRYG